MSEKLPDSTEEVKSLVFVAVMAGLASLARVLYGKEEIRWRVMVGSAAMGMVTSVVIYGLAVQYFGQIGGQASAAIGAGVGVFCDDLLRRLREYVANKKLPGEQPSPPAPLPGGEGREG